MMRRLLAVLFIILAVATGFYVVKLLTTPTIEGVWSTKDGSTAFEFDSGNAVIKYSGLAPYHASYAVTKTDGDSVGQIDFTIEAGAGDVKFSMAYVLSDDVLTLTDLSTKDVFTLTRVKK